MAAYAEGLNVIENADIGAREHEIDAETTPLRDPQYYPYDIDIAEVAEVWRRGSVIASWLLDLTASALQESPELEEFGGRVSDSGEGRWTLHAAIDEGVPAPVLSTALYERFASRERGRVRQQAALGDAQAVRRPRREARRSRRLSTLVDGDLPAAAADAGAARRYRTPTSSSSSAPPATSPRASCCPGFFHLDRRRPAPRALPDRRHRDRRHRRRRLPRARPRGAPGVQPDRRDRRGLRSLRGPARPTSRSAPGRRRCGTGVDAGPPGDRRRDPAAPLPRGPAGRLRRRSSRCSATSA